MEEVQKETIVPHLADLARIELTAEEQVRYERDITEIIEFVGKIANVKVSSQPLTTTISGVSQVMRADQVEQSDLADSLLAQAPKTRNRLVLVPKIL
ncbi:MAG: Asp-tRNA(Asn)/Glu-tRNA(Gln) amidotransferase subunit GatC [bacterium]|nr:Asp-tRNA(Asn)/Glu-tRNA(Gln) amidotransferase subunit GatC [bacterium]